MRDLIASVEGEYRRYRKLGEAAMRQLTDEQLIAKPSAESNSIATIAWHVSGNLESRFTDFLTSDGEKPWRDREDEFAERRATRDEILAKWNRGWDVLTATLATLEDADLPRTITIREVGLTVAEALHRSVAHTAAHVGQITYVGKLLRGAGWEYLSIPPGGTAAYNADPTREKA